MMYNRRMSKPKQPTDPATDFKRVTVTFQTSDWRKMRQYALAEDTSLQAIITESVAAWMAKKGVKLG